MKCKNYENERQAFHTKEHFEWIMLVQAITRNRISIRGNHARDSCADVFLQFGSAAQKIGA